MTARPFDTIRTRFAPSPTGYLHIGGARTALFNYLLARRLGGKFVLRIEDTDQTRNIAGAETKLFEDLRWLGLQWDEGPEVGGPFGPYHQSRRLEAYHAVARQLIDAGHAYYAMDTDAELAALRDAARREKRNFRYPRPARFPTHDEAEAARRAARPVVVRLKTPEQPFVVRDLILGDVTIAAGEVDDFVLLKSDTWPTYHFAVVVDDEQMRITHVLRGQEHLINTPKHMALQQALGYHTPQYAHLPIIMNMDGSKMSKREKGRAVLAAFEAAASTGALDPHGAVRIAGVDPPLFDAWRRGDTQLEGAALYRLAQALGVQPPEIEIHDFRQSGYLPEVIVNFIALLGWSAGDDREKFTLAELVESFDVARVGKTNARFDRAKLLNFNTTAAAAAPLERNLAGLKDFLGANESSPLAALTDDELRRLITMNAGFRTYRDIETKCAPLIAPDDAIRYPPKAVQDHWLKSDGAGLRVLRDLEPLLRQAPEWRAAALEALLRAYGERRGVALGKVAQPLRVALTGTTISPPIFESLELLGRDRTLMRIGRALAHAAAVSAA